MELEPLGDRIYILLDEKIEKVGQIFVSESASERTRMATVKKMGPDCERTKRRFLKKSRTKLNIGDRIVVMFYAGNVLHLLGESILDERHRIVMEGEIMARIKE